MAHFGYCCVRAGRRRVLPHVRRSVLVTIDAPTDVYTVEGAPTIRTTRKVELDVGNRYEIWAHAFKAGRDSMTPGDTGTKNGDNANE